MKILLVLASFAGLCTFCFVDAAAALNAVQQCSALHRLNLSQLQTNGTVFTDGGCKLKCVLDDILISSDPINEGSNCSVIPDGVCLNGTCVNRIANLTTVAPTSAPTPAPIYPFVYKFAQLNVTIQHSILHETLKETDIIYVTYSHKNSNHHQNCLTGSYFPVANIAWHSHCLFQSGRFGGEYIKFDDDSLMIFAFNVNDQLRASQTLPIVLTFRKYLVDHPNSVADGKVEFLQVFHLVDSVNNQRLADLYVKFEFLKVTKVNE